MDAQYLKPVQDHDAPIYFQLYQRYKQAIEEGRLKPGDRVSSVRSLASELNLARGTVEAAYQMLVSEGYFVARGAAGTVVSPELGVWINSRRTSTSAIHSDSPVLPAASANEPTPFMLGVPALDAFPRKTWSRLAGRSLRRLETSAMLVPDPAGFGPLRQAIAKYLGISRGIACEPEQVFVTTGYRGALDLVQRTLLKAGDTGWYEDPGYIFAREFLLRCGLRLMPVPVDEEGLCVEEGRRLLEHARFAVVTPTHQSPMGQALSLPRRLVLLEWANQHQAWIIEDDYDSEFRYHGRPLPALKSLDAHERVLYTGCFSKVLLPGLRLAYLVVPKAQIERFKNSVAHTPGAGSIMPQALVADFIEQGHFARHLRKMRTLYAERRRFLVDALENRLGSHLYVEPQAGGIQMLAYLKGQQDDRRIMALAESKGLTMQALSAWYMHEPRRQGLIMGFANFPDAGQAEAAVELLASAVEAARQGA